MATHDPRQRGVRDPLTGDGAPTRRRSGSPSGPRSSGLHATVESDGTPAGTRVFLSDGTELTQIRSVSWRIDPGAEAVLTVELGLAGLHAVGRLDVQAGVTPGGSRTTKNRRTT